MKAGILKERIEIYKQQNEVTEFGNKTRKWEYFLTTKSCVVHKRGTIENQNKELVRSFSKEFIVRRYINVDENMRVKYNDRFYRILDVEDNIAMNDKVITAEIIND